MNRLVCIIWVLFFVSCQTSRPIQDQRYSSAIEQSRQFVQQVQQEQRIPGAAVAVSVQGKLVWSEGFGYANLEEQIPVDPARHQFRIGSVSKPLTAVGMAVLYEDGKIDLDAPIQTYVPSFPEKEYPITLRQLAGHLAGIRHYKGVEFWNNKKYESVSAGLTIFQNDPLLHEPGTKYAYSSYGWNLISAAMETAANQDFLSFMEEAVFDPLDMHSTEPDHSDRIMPDRVQFYDVLNDSLQRSPAVDNSYKWAGGGFLSSAEDLIRFGNAQLNDKLLEEDTRQLFIQSQSTKDGKMVNYGMGWRSNKDKKDRYWFGHSGGSVGGSTFLIIYPEEQIVVVVLANQGRSGLNDLSFRIANQFLSVSN